MSIYTHFSNLNLTNGQRDALKMIDNFLEDQSRVFILKGYAGTGKTTLIKGLVSYLNSLQKNFKVMAPTGRAAKVIQQKTSIDASTIHSGIYSMDKLKKQETEEDVSSASYTYKFKINETTYSQVIIVDEASMISNVNSENEYFMFGTGQLLADLFTYANIFSDHLTTKIIFVGDPAQLPPVGMAFSPALDSQYLKENFHVEAAEFELTEVKRQDVDNGILKAATSLRKSLIAGYFNDFDLRENGIDIYNPTLSDFITTYKKVEGKKIVICYKNKTQKILNALIRNDKYGQDLPIQVGDIMIAGKNNYKNELMNGEFGLVKTIAPNSISRKIAIKSKGGNGKRQEVSLSWRMITMLTSDEHGQIKQVEGYLLENYLYGDSDLTSIEMQALYIDFLMRNENLKPTAENFPEILKNDPFFNSLMLKYGYVITCHKAQGGEWPNTFIFWDKGGSTSEDSNDSNGIRKGRTNNDFYRWAYTAITRSSQRLFCIDPPYYSSLSSLIFVEDNLNKELNNLEAYIQESVDIAYTDEIKNLFDEFSLHNLQYFMQDHFLAIWYQLKAEGIRISSYSTIAYEVKYQFHSNQEMVGIKFWFNGKGEFKTNFQQIPALTNSPSLFEKIAKLIDRLPLINLRRNTTELIESNLSQQITKEEDLPFLQLLEHELRSVLNVDINIDNIEHLNYKERYLFTRKSEKAVLDFDYNSQGFFGRVSPLMKYSNSPQLITDLRDKVLELKQRNSSYVI